MGINYDIIIHLSGTNAEQLADKIATEIDLNNWGAVLGVDFFKPEHKVNKSIIYFTINLTNINIYYLLEEIRANTEQEGGTIQQIYYINLDK